jgi:hypothetical protein
MCGIVVGCQPVAGRERTTAPKLDDIQWKLIGD